MRHEEHKTLEEIGEPEHNDYQYAEELWNPMQSVLPDARDQQVCVITSAGSLNNQVPGQVWEILEPDDSSEMPFGVGEGSTENWELLNAETCQPVEENTWLLVEDDL